MDERIFSVEATFSGTAIFHVPLPESSAGLQDLGTLTQRFGVLGLSVRGLGFRVWNLGFRLWG